MPRQISRLNAHLVPAIEPFQANLGVVQAAGCAVIADGAILRAALEAGILRLDVFGDNALVVAEDGGAVGLADHIAGVDGRLSAATGEVYDEFGHRETGGVAY